MPSLLEVSGLRAGYGLFSVLHGLDFHVAEREIVSLVGSNGAGKTTMRAVSGLIAPSGGTIRFDGKDTTGLSPSQMVARGLVCVRKAASCFPDDRARHPAGRRLHAARQATARREPGARLPAFPEAEGTPRPIVRHAFRRRTADGRHRPGG